MPAQPASGLPKRAWQWLAVPVLLLQAGTAIAECRLGLAATMPLRLENGHLIVSMDINNQAANLVLDTGAFATILNTASARRLGVRTDRLRFNAEGIGGERQLYGGKVGRMGLGQMNADGITLGVTDLWTDARYAGYDGVFGMNMMSAYDVDLDLPGRRAMLYQPQGGCSKPAVALGPELYTVPLVALDEGRSAQINLLVEGHHFRAVLDTGASSTAMYRKAASRMGLDLSGLSVPGHRTVGGVGPAKVAALRHVFKTVQIGDLQIQNMPIDILAQRNSGIETTHIGSLIAADDEEGGEDMLLGADFMSKVHLWISRSSETLVMQFPPLPSPVKN